MNEQKEKHQNIQENSENKQQFKHKHNNIYILNSKILNKMKKKTPFFLTQRFMGIFLIAIMGLSLVGIFSSNLKADETEEYKDYKFYPLNSIWFTYYQGKQIAFQYLPQQVENISSIANIHITGDKIYFLQDPNTNNISTTTAKQKLATILYEKNIRIVEACTQKENCPEDYPIKNCETLDSTAILFKSSNKTQITKQYMCYIIEADSSLNLFKATERLIYQMIGIIE